ncbi:unnamed protein product, partial [Vitis vinifera]|uniref:Uncharacterized protein n=1 Tax=Vitis vinifera TaxID=29760 RepID=D7U5P7_VITVI
MKIIMTFRQVVLQQLWNFELLLFRPGAIRNMEELQDPRKVPASFSLSSSDESVIFVLAEVIYISALQRIRMFSRGVTSYLSVNIRERKLQGKRKDKGIGEEVGGF